MWFFKNYGILGQNARNLNYIGEYNDDLAKKLADSKLKTKEFLSNKGVRVSESIAILKNHEELDDFDLNSLPLPFVVKPNAGYGGKGIIIFEKKDELGNFVSNDNQIFSLTQLKNHVSDILDGFYSLSGSRDKVIFERKIILDHSIDLLGKYGLPDIRVIVFNSIPVIAMLRVPTANSKGKANLHGGACGLGVDIGSGKITYITQFKKMIKSVPGIGDVRGIEIPQWEEILKLAVKVQQITNIGYVGCDIVLDDVYGPLLLEMNVRPGLEVQVANKIPLLERLKKVENIKVNSVEKGVRLARDLFGGDIEEKIKNISGKKVLGVKEYIEIFVNEKPIKCIGEIRVIKNQSFINREFLIHSLKIDESKIKADAIKLKCNILGEVRTIKFDVKELEGINVILGRDILYGFLVDPFKYKEHDLPIDARNPLIKEKNTVILKGYGDQLLKLDKDITDVDKKLHLLKIITPKNIQSERLKFVNSEGKYIPKLEYNEIPFSLGEEMNNILKIEIPDIPLASIYKRKKEEIINKIQFLNAFKNQNIKELNKYSKLLFGDIIAENLAFTQETLLNKPEIYKETEFLTFEEIKEYLNKFNHIYNINISLSEKEIGSRFSIKGDKLLIKNGSLVGKKEIRSVIAHEVETHYLRRWNGQKSKYQIFSNGGANYSLIEEGLAVYNQNKFITKHDAKYYAIFERYYFMHYGMTHSYSELIEEFKKFYNNDYNTIFNFLVRFKRGSRDVSSDFFFNKDLVYVNGYFLIKDFFRNGGHLNELYFGKISLEDLADIKKSDLINMKIDDLKIPFFN